MALSMNRRRFVVGGAVASAALFGGYSWSTRYLPDLSNLSQKPKLAMPTLLDATDTGRFDLTAMAGKTNFLGRTPTQTIGYNQSYLGPTLRLKNGTYSAQLSNKINEPVTVHWHGLAIPGEQDGGPHQPIQPSELLTTDLDIDQPPATVWYHTHAHQRTAIQVHTGLAGAIQLVDGRDKDRGLPDQYGVDDLLLVLQDRRFDQRGVMVYDTGMMNAMHGQRGDTILVNGQIGTVAAVPNGIARLRLLNGSNARIYTLFMSDRRPMHLAATDGGYLPSTIALNEVRLAPGERAEVLVDFTNSEPVALMSQPDTNFGPGGMMGRFQGALNATLGSAFTILPFAVDNSVQSSISRIPDKLDGDKPALDQKAAAISRELVLDVGMGGGMMGGRGGSMAINDRSFDMNRIDLEIKKGTIEHWRIKSSMLAHPFHIHGLQFQVISENGKKPRAENTGWKDTVLIASEAEILVKFDHSASKSVPYMAHCHILEHEDAGMMMQFSVV